MNRRTGGSLRRRGGVLAAVAILGSTAVVVLGQGSAAATSNKPFSVTLCAADGQSCSPGNAQVVAPGSASGTTPAPVSLTATITDETTKGGGLTIGSVNLTAPAGVTITAANYLGSLGTCTSATPATTSCISADGSTLELRGLNVAPGSSIQVPISIATPPPPSSCTTTSPCQWTAEAKQSNDYNGPPGNQLNLDAGSSQLGIILSSEATCTSAKKSNSCSTTLGDGGASGSTGGSVTITTSATGTSGGIFYQSIDYGPHLDANTECSGIDSIHDEYVSGAALNGTSARSFTVTITTTDYPKYVAELCLTTSKPFTAKVLHTGSAPTLAPAVQVTQPDGTLGYAGLLPDCTGGTAPTVNCKTLPGVVSRSTSPDGTVHTIVASFPAGFDATMRN